MSITIDKIKKANKTFFEPETVKAHGDKGYEIVFGGEFLKVITKRGEVFYSIDPRTYVLTYCKC